MDVRIDIGLSQREYEILRKNRKKQESRKVFKKDVQLSLFLAIFGLILGGIFTYFTDYFIPSIVFPILGIGIAVIINIRNKKNGIEIEGIYIKIEEKIRDNILNKFNKKFVRIKEKKENLLDLTNLINNKINLELTELDVFGILLLNEQAIDYDIFKNSIENIEFKDSMSFAVELMKVYRDIEFVNIRNEKQKHIIFFEILERYIYDFKLDVDFKNLRDEMYKIYKKERSDKFEKEICNEE